MAKAHTIKDVAFALGVSPATVSRALAGHPRISRETRDKVEAKAAELGYVANRSAQNLVNGSGSGFVGLVLTDPGYGREDSYLSEFLSGLGRGLTECGVDLFLSAIPQGQSELSVIRNIVNTRRADGLILARTEEVDKRVEFLLERKFPFVTHGRILRDEGQYPWLDTDGEAAFAQAFELLYALGHRRFALMTIEEPMTFRMHRSEGLQRAIEAKADPCVTLQVVTAPRYEAARRDAAMEAMLSGPERPTAVLCLFDGLALSVLAKAAALGLSVPDVIHPH
ncbi:MAG: LacI family DNA-binding transcriptional regulator [Aestuariivirgaceae bacterium]|nr:LacI family DNA-binding transcriptional regulator [Aestuariivirgaceae bacterium]